MTNVLRAVGAFAGTLAIISFVAGCSVIGLAPPGSRQLVIPVENRSARAASVAVTNDDPQRPAQVGTANPATVGPGVTRDVTFTVPAGEQWAIVVNGQTLIVPPDVEGQSGRLRITIHVSADGNIGWSDPGPGPP